MAWRENHGEWTSLAQVMSGQKVSAVPTTTALLTERLANRDLSWLLFNDRVLSEAEDAAVPSLERLKFASIVSSNLDEFFMIRVAGIARIARRTPHVKFPDGLTAQQLLAQIREHVLRQKASQAKAFQDIVATLMKQGVSILTTYEDKGADREIRKYAAGTQVAFRRPTEPLPELMHGRIYVFVRFSRGYALMDVGERENRLIRLAGAEGEYVYALVDRWLAARAEELFKDRGVIESFPFKIIRDADLMYEPEKEEFLEWQILQRALKRRREAKVIRLEVDAPSYSEGALLLATQLGLDSASLYRFDLPLDLTALSRVYEEGPAKLRYPPIKPKVPPPLRGKSVLEAVRKRDLLLHHPYDTFDVVVEFLIQAARDPAVREITHTIYRTSRESPVIEALKEAARQGKKVTAYVEIKARFDEEANIHWSEELRQGGVKVVQPLGQVKVHYKMTRIVREEEGKEVVYTHMGTGNYHPGTARLYTDLGMLTADPGIGEETGKYFAALANRKKPPRLKELLIAPETLQRECVRLIREQIKIQKSGEKGRVIAKMNSLVDPDIIEALYEASMAGVKVDLIVRGICCLRAGISGLSENIRVISIVDKFLEHSRVYCFGPRGKDTIYLSSADWMPRNFYSRHEIAFPVKDHALKRFIREMVLAKSLADNAKAWELQPDGTYAKVVPADGTEVMRSQAFFEQLAIQDYRGTVMERVR